MPDVAIKVQDRIKEQIAQEGLVARTRKSREWLRDMVKTVRMPGAAKYAFVNISRNSLSVAEFAQKIKTGYVRMFFYFYDPKTKDKPSLLLKLKYEMTVDDVLDLKEYYEYENLISYEDYLRQKENQK